jgi:hypothetical protein
MPESRRGVKWPVVVFVLFHALMMLTWSIPMAPEPLRVHTRWDARQEDKDRALKPQGHLWINVLNDKYFRNGPTRHYPLYTGTWQYWDMFAPNPSNLDFYIDAEVLYRDGERAMFKYPRMSQLGVMEKYYSERFRKFSERVIDEKHSYLWPYFAQRIALESFRKSGKIPYRVYLHIYRRRIDWLQPRPDFTDIVFYEHVVNQAKVRELAQK